MTSDSFKRERNKNQSRQHNESIIYSHVGLTKMKIKLFLDNLFEVSMFIYLFIYFFDISH